MIFFSVLWPLLCEPFVLAPSPSTSRRRPLVHGVTTAASTKEEIRGLSNSADFEDAINGTDLSIIKFYAPWCRACRGLEPKYKRISTEYSKKGFVFFEMSHKELASSEPDFLQKHEVNVLPLVQFYDAGQRVESFPCGPRKIELLREKLDFWHAKKHSSSFLETEDDLDDDDLEVNEEQVQGVDDVRKKKKQNPLRRSATAVLREVELFKPLKDEQLEQVIKEAKVTRYDAGAVLVAEGDVGRRFYVILDGECDVYQESEVVSEDRLSGFSPDATRTAYGVRTNTLKNGAFFGERALAENKPRQASVVAATKVTALTFERKTLENAGVDFRALVGGKGESRWGYEKTRTTTTKAAGTPGGDDGQKTQRIFDSLSVMQRLRLVRSCVRAFEQAASRTPNFGDANEIAYRQNLVQQLTYHQRLEFEQTFSLLDRNGDGMITIDELRSLMKAFGRDDLQDTDLSDMINKANPVVDGNLSLNKHDFLALMAQAEFSAMFLETFKLLDPHALGFLEADQLWKVMDTLLAIENDDDDEDDGDGGGDEKNTNKNQKSRHKDLHSFRLNYHYLAESFGIDEDAQIDYAAFVKILLSSSGSSLAPPPSKAKQSEPSS